MSTCSRHLVHYYNTGAAANAVIVLEQRSQSWDPQILKTQIFWKSPGQIKIVAGGSYQLSKKF